MKYVLWLLLLTSCASGSKVYYQKTEVKISGGQIHLKPLAPTVSARDTVMEVIMIVRKPA